MRLVLFHGKISVLQKCNCFPLIFTCAKCATHPECFDSDGDVVSLPDGLVDVSVLASAEFVLHHNVCPVHLPLIHLCKHTPNQINVATNQNSIIDTECAAIVIMYAVALSKSDPVEEYHNGSKALCTTSKEEIRFALFCCH